MLIRLIVPLVSVYLLFCAGCGANSEGNKNGSLTANNQNAGGESVQPAPAAPADDSNRILACSVITSEEIQAVLGEPVKERKGSDTTNQGLSVSHCVYLLPTYVKSLSLDIVRADPAGSGKDSIEKFWESRFRDSSKEREEERKREERAQNREKEEEEGETKPRRIVGVGEEAYWVGGRTKGLLYVRDKQVVMALSLGGPEDEATKIKRSRTLLSQALKRIK